MQAQVLALEVRAGQALDAERWVARNHAILDGRVQTDHEPAQRVVDRLSAHVPRLDRLRLLLHPRSNVID